MFFVRILSLSNFYSFPDLKKNKIVKISKKEKNKKQKEISKKNLVLIG